MKSKEKAVESDWLDDYVQGRSERSPAFAEAWAGAEQELELAQARKQAGLTQAQVAKVMGISQPRVAEIEREPDRVALGIMRKYAAAVGMEMTLRPKAEGKSPAPVAGVRRAGKRSAA